MTFQTIHSHNLENCSYLLYYSIQIWALEGGGGRGGAYNEYPLSFIPSHNLPAPCKQLIWYFYLPSIIFYKQFYFFLDFKYQKLFYFVFLFNFGYIIFESVVGLFLYFLFKNTHFHIYIFHWCDVLRIIKRHT